METGGSLPINEFQIQKESHLKNEDGEALGEDTSCHLRPSCVCVCTRPHIHLLTHPYLPKQKVSEPLLRLRDSPKLPTTSWLPWLSKLCTDSPFGLPACLPIVDAALSLSYPTLVIGTE